MDTLVEDIKLIQKSQFHSDIEMCASVMYFSLRELKKISKNTGIPIEQMTVDHIIDWMISRHGKPDASV
jgi:hypothetical protein